MARKDVPESVVRQESETSVVRSAGAMGAATFLSRIMGLVREQVFAIFFGAGNLTDAFNIAFRIPNLLRDLFAEGALSSAFVPTFTRVRIERGERAAWRVAGLVFRALFVLVGVLSVVGILFAPELVRLYAASYQQVPGKFELTVFMTRVLFPFFPLVALAAAFMGILNACGKFFMPAFASALFNVASVVFGVILSFVVPRFGLEPIVGMAIGVVIGGAVQAFSQLPLLYRVGYRWQARREGDLPWHREPALRRILTLMLPGIVGLAATQVNVLINSILATKEGTGAVSWLTYAFRLMQFPIGVFGVSLAAATLPRVSKLFVEKDFDAIRVQLTQTLKNVFTVNLPASAGLAFLGVPIIQLLFEYGRFTPNDTGATAWALMAYAVGLTAYSGVKVLVPACYATGRMKHAVISSVLSVGVTIGFSLWLVKPYSFIGLAMATSIAAFFNLLYLTAVLRDFLSKWQLVRSFFTHLAIAAVMGYVCHLTWEWLRIALSESRLPYDAGNFVTAAWRAMRVAILVAEGALLTFALGWIFRVAETRQMADFFSKKLKNRLRRGKNPG